MKNKTKIPFFFLFFILFIFSFSCQTIKVSTSHCFSEKNLQKVSGKKVSSVKKVWLFFGTIPVNRGTPRVYPFPKCSYMSISRHFEDWIVGTLTVGLVRMRTVSLFVQKNDTTEYQKRVIPVEPSRQDSLIKLYDKVYIRK